MKVVGVTNARRIWFQLLKEVAATREPVYIQVQEGPHSERAKSTAKLLLLTDERLRELEAEATDPEEKAVFQQWLDKRMHQQEKQEPQGSPLVLAEVTSDRQLSIPEAIARKLGLQPGDKLAVSVEHRTLFATPVKRRRGNG